MSKRRHVPEPRLQRLPALILPGVEEPLAVSAQLAPGLVQWAAEQRSPRPRTDVRGLRFAFYWRVSTEDHQDPATSRAWQLGRAQATIAGAGTIVVEFSDIGQSRSVAPQRRPGASQLLAALGAPDRGFDALVIGSHERAFFGNQYSLIASILRRHGVPLWMPELGGEVDPSIGTVEELLALLGILSKREIIRARQRSTSAMAAQVRDQGRYEGGRVPYGLVLVDAGPHPNRRDASRGRQLQRFDLDPTQGPIVPGSPAPCSTSIRPRCGAGWPAGPRPMGTGCPGRSARG
jgi:DNA invertase Pin-like site-specific DNA recombinase